MANDCIPFYDDADIVSGICSAAVTGKRFVKISGNRAGAGSNLSIAHADAGGRKFGVSGFDGAIGEYVPVYHAPGVIVPVLAGAAITAFDEVMVGANGVAIPATARADSGPASLVTGVVGSNNAIRWTAREPGVIGNALQVALVVAGNSTPLSVAVVGNLITVNVATSAGGAAVSTATEVIAAVRAAVADALVTVANESTSTGAGVVAAVPATNLAGGADETTPVNKVGYAVTGADNGTDAQISLY